jgi:hypothetical protein
MVVKWLSLQFHTWDGSHWFLGEHQASSTMIILGNGKNLHAKQSAPCRLRLATRSPQGAGPDRLNLSIRISQPFSSIFLSQHISIGHRLADRVLDYTKEDEMVVRRSAIAIVRLVEEDDRRARLLIGIDGKLIATSKLCRLLLGLAALGASKQCRTRFCLGELSASTWPPKFFAWLLVQEQIQTYS